MDALQKIVSRRLTDHSQKRHSKRLVAEMNNSECAYGVNTTINSSNVINNNSTIPNDDWNLHILSLNPNFEMLSCEVQCSNGNDDSLGNDLMVNSLSNVDHSMIPSPQGSSSVSSDGYSSNTSKLSVTAELNSNELINVPRDGRERAIHKVSSVVRKKLSLSNLFSKHLHLYGDEDCESDIDGSCKGRRSSARCEVKKAAKTKPKRKKVDLIDVRILGRRQENENQHLLIEEIGDDD
ncbi:unnamed protein product [Anisakis simplex]|uniref:Suppressor protein SRP40-like n=1 Tax=Anisakis simplex TaxID=6269 RepID=A0A0M3JVP0_ANISI|nr:unnamed protein product [Anisakis simplex]